MIRFRDKILEEYSIDPETAVITNSKGEIQNTSIHKDGYAYFKSMAIHKIQVHTHYGYKKCLVIHHLDHNKMNNSLSNLLYLTQSGHMKIHNESISPETKKKLSESLKGRTFSEETKKKMSDAKKGEKSAWYGKHHSEEIKEKISNSHKGKHHTEESKRKISESRRGKFGGEKHPMYGKRYKWVNNGFVNKQIPLDDEIPEGFVRGRLKK